MCKIKGAGNEIPIGYISSEVRNRHIETISPFFYFIYSIERDIHITIKGHKFSCKKKQGVFINKSTPFSILLNCKECNTQSSDIIAIRFTSKDIIEHNFLFDREFSRLKEMPLAISRGFFIFDFNLLDNIELTSISWIIEQCSLQCLKTVTSESESESEKIYSKVKVSFFLSYLMHMNDDISCLFHSVSLELTSEKVALLIMSDYSKSWTIEELANNLLMSPSLFKKKMYNEVGSITTFINKLKLTEALRRLRTTNESVSKIATFLGYNSVSYFSKVFKKHLDLHPTDLRLKR
ncbi:AraC family transcriptional regulator [Salmonella enterica subsp. enterica]|uniref:Helix-turn-helix transcriptional regulator n=3 Tax=Salmonella enterica TaxID=28901 RepID=A0A743QBP8_SALER|nr:AraC family transcriptional regulator [Salmonella enterica subsp. enterica serovar Bareilly]EAB9226177.1 AraC family transcriptional regulator [Salmonella enterica subsp. enterica serovar Typhimurium]EBF8326305.1 helix-turn-helix transcriptional regulator [Salmonella enterica]ECG5506098.1 AraC family transcriptional regulator [Salmonella enterica subsp. enterica serovar Newport]EGH0386727.1 helix-turn-helix transcriptional regulator [Salmonella enterica subsp. enterica serovar Hvittingfoss]